MEKPYCGCSCKDIQHALLTAADAPSVPNAHPIGSWHSERRELWQVQQHCWELVSFHATWDAASHSTKCKASARVLFETCLAPPSSCRFGGRRRGHELHTSRLRSVLLYGKSLSIEGIVCWSHEFRWLRTCEAPLEGMTKDRRANIPSMQL